MSEFQKSFKEDSRRSIKFLKEVQERLESSLPKCSQRAAKDVPKLTKQYQNLFQLNKLRYGRNTEPLNGATVVSKHRCDSLKPSKSMPYGIAMKSNVKNCRNKKPSSLSNTTLIILRGGQILAVNENNEIKVARATPNAGKCRFVDDLKIENKAFKKRKRLDETNQPTELNSLKKIKIEKKKITVVEYFARKRHEDEMKIFPVNENSKKRKRELSEDCENNASKYCSNALSGVLDAPCLNAPKKAKLTVV